MMKARYFTLVTAVLLLLLTACGGSRAADTPCAPATSRTAFSGSVPPPAADPAITGLLFAYGVGARNVLDTTRGTFTKDMVMRSPLTVPLQLSPEELARIAERIDEIGLLSYPAHYIAPCGVNGATMVTPFASYRIVIRTDEGDKVVTWDDHTRSDDVRAVQLRGLARLIERLISASPDYQSLPQPEGMYM